MTKVVYNRCHGGFGLSKQAEDLYFQLSGRPSETEAKNYWVISCLDRADPFLVQVVETLGKLANGNCANLAIKDIPAGTRYRINDYDGYETIELDYNVKWSIA